MDQRETDRTEPEAGVADSVALTLPRVTIQPDLDLIRDTVTSMAVLGQHIQTVLVKDLDYGHIPGVPGSMLFDSGAAKLINVFNCYAGERRVINFTDDGSKISVIVEVPLIHRATGKPVATGIGAASTLETKHKYRWIDNMKDLEVLGYGEEERAKLKTKTDRTDGTILYRVPNPEHGDLLNTIIKMAAKRAEVDAAESLPAVASTLKPLFDGRLAPTGQGTRRPPMYEPQTTSSGQQRSGPSDPWSSFWGEISRMGLTREQVLAFFKASSMAQYMEQTGKDQAALLYELRDALSKHTI